MHGHACGILITTKDTKSRKKNIKLRVLRVLRGEKRLNKIRNSVSMEYTQAIRFVRYEDRLPCFSSCLRGEFSK